MRIKALAVIILALPGCMPSSGPSPNAVLVIDSKNYPVSQLLAPLDSMRSLDARIDKRGKFPIYDTAYWYSADGSAIYGVSLVEWRPDIQGEWAQDVKARYFIEIYAKDKTCAMCGAVKKSLERSHIRFRSACERPSTAYERTRCGT